MLQGSLWKYGYFPKNLLIDEKELYDLASMMKNILKRLQSINAPYNYFLTYAPNGEKLRFHIEICPRITTWAGFEIATGTIINPVSPEEAAKFYKNKDYGNENSKNGFLFH